MAADPPNSKNVRKTDASEKLTAKRERGRARLIRGATIVENARTSKNPQLNASCVRLAIASTKQIPPPRMTVPFA